MLTKVKVSEMTTALNNNSQTLRYDPVDDPIARRLGTAVANHWHDLTDEAQTLILHKAIRVLDPDPAMQLPEQINQFIAKKTDPSSSRWGDRALKISLIALDRGRSFGAYIGIR